MRSAILVAGLAVLVAGCETFEPYSVEFDQILDQSGVAVYGNLMEDIAGERWWQFTASNSNAFSVCVQTSLTGGRTSGHSMGGIHLLAPGQSTDIGYVELPGDFRTSSAIWTPQADGNCGSPPP
jgi:hypothetical protein